MSSSFYKAQSKSTFLVRIEKDREEGDTILVKSLNVSRDNERILRLLGFSRGDRGYFCTYHLFLLLTCKLCE